MESIKRTYNPIPNVFTTYRLTVHYTEKILTVLKSSN
jgi:hypothetical protein